MSKFASTIRGLLYTSAAGFGSSLMRVPESYRSHLPYAVDLPSVASNFIPCLAIGVFAMRQRELVKAMGRLPLAAYALTISAMANIAVETNLVQKYYASDELMPVIGGGTNGELRDLLWGLGGTVLGTAIARQQDRYKNFSG